MNVIVSAIYIAAVSTTIYYLATRATITAWLWRRWPRPLAALLDCSACSGWWYGIGAYWALNLPLGRNALEGSLLAGCLGLVLTPIVAFTHTYAWSALTPPSEVGSDVAADAANVPRGTAAVTAVDASTATSAQSILDCDDDDVGNAAD